MLQLKKYYTSDWNNYRKRRRLSLGLFLGYIPATLLWAYSIFYFHFDERLIPIFAIAWMILVGIFSNYSIYFLCPRCQKEFFSSKWGYNSWTRTCLHCKFPKWKTFKPFNTEHLPAEVLEKAIRNGNELGWRFQDVPFVIESTRQHGIVNLGGQAQFVYPVPNSDTCATYEIYWINVDNTDRFHHESDSQYVDRSARDVLKNFQKKINAPTFEREGLDCKALCEAAKRDNKKLSDYLIFILYFEQATQ